MVENQPILYGRRVGKPLSARRRRLMADLFPALRIDTQGRRRPVAGLFPQAPGKVVLEIGFGSGEHLVAAAAADPRTGFIGVEPFVNGLAKAVSEIDRLGLRNIRLFDDDAAVLMDWLGDGVLTRVELPYPDPWPKRRHHKRRFVQPENLDRVARVLARGATFLIATDAPDYAAWSLLHMRRHPAFAWRARRAEDWHHAPMNWTPTRYETKARAAGRPPLYLEFERI